MADEHSRENALVALGLGPVEPEDVPCIDELRQERAQYHDDDLARVTWERNQLQEALKGTLLTVEAYAHQLLDAQGVACCCSEWPAFESLQEEPETGGWNKDCLLHGYPPQVIRDTRRLLALMS